MSLFTKQKNTPKARDPPLFLEFLWGPITSLECALNLFSGCTRFWPVSFFSKVTRCENISSSRCKWKKYMGIKFIQRSTLAPHDLLKGTLLEADQKWNGTDFTTPRSCLDPISSLGPFLPTPQWYPIITVHKHQPWQQFRWLHHYYLCRSSRSTKLAYSWSVELQAPNTVNCFSFPFVSLAKCVILAL